MTRGFRDSKKAFYQLSPIERKLILIAIWATSLSSLTTVIYSHLADKPLSNLVIWQSVGLVVIDSAVLLFLRKMPYPIFIFIKLAVYLGIPSHLIRAIAWFSTQNLILGGVNIAFALIFIPALKPASKLPNIFSRNHPKEGVSPDNPSQS